MKYAIASIFTCFLSFTLLSQSTGIKGLITDNHTSEPLISATIYIGDLGTTSNFDGSFEIDLAPGTYTLIASYIGYRDETLSITIEDEEYLQLDISLKQTNTLLETATISGSKYERRLAESPVSISVIKSELVESTNTIEISTLLDKIPGVQLIDDQANIRGGSGFSFGAGSRVMLLIDDVPTMQPDAGRPNWSDIPVENISQIEVLKGASSVMYGSAALNGIINVRTGYAVSEPVTKFNVSYQQIFAPKDFVNGGKRISRKWWDDGLGNAPNRMNASFMHKRKIGKLDLVAHAYVDDYDHFYQEAFKKKLRGSVNLRYRLNDRVVVGMNSLVNRGHTNIPFLRRDATAGSYIPLEGTLSNSKNLRMYFDPYINIYDRKKNQHKLLMRYYYIDNNNNNNQSNSSTNYYADYQHSRMLNALDLRVSGGFTAFRLTSDSEYFDEGDFYANNLGAYMQLEKKLFDKINLSAGLRYEYNSHLSPEVVYGEDIPGGKISEGKLIKRFSANGELTPATFVRASYGEGYRFPTVVERFIFTNFAGFSIFPNVNIGSEFGWSTEIGIKQGFDIGAFRGFIDYSTFWSRYEDMLEFTFATIDGALGFQTNNVGNVDIKGHEINITGQVHLFSIPFNILTGYTFIQPTYQDFETNEDIRNSILPLENALKYRSKHNFKIDLEGVYNKLRLGVAFNRTSHMRTIDGALGTRSEINAYREIDMNGYYKMDARMSYQFDLVKVSLISNNVLNEIYAARPGFFEEPRSLAMRLDFDL